MIQDAQDCQKKKLTLLIDKLEDRIGEKMRQMEFDINNNFEMHQKLASTKEKIEKDPKPENVQRVDMKEVDRRIKASIIDMDEIDSKIKESEERIMSKIKAIENTTAAIHDSAKRTKKKALLI